MNRDDIEPGDEPRPEYVAGDLKAGVRGKHFDRYRSGTNLALLAPEVRSAFPTDEEVNQALRSPMNPPQAS